VDLFNINLGGGNNMNIAQVKDNKLKLIPKQSYRDEDKGGFGEKTLQELLADYPELIPAARINPGDPPKFVVVRREANVTAGYMDILLLDQNAVPTIIETKLGDNPEMRRKVIAQGLEYLAHLQTEWDEERFLNEATNYWENKEESFEDHVLNKWEKEMDTNYLEHLQANIDSANMRLIIAGDKIPSELKRLIEFMNSTSQFEVLGLEVSLFSEDDNPENKYLIPELLGSSEQAREKRSSTRGKWSEEKYFEVLKENNDIKTVEIISDIYNWSKENSDRIWFGHGEKGTFTFHFVMNNKTASIFTITTKGHLILNYGWLSRKLENKIILGFHKEINKISAFENISEDFTRWPSIKIAEKFVDQKADIEGFKKAVISFGKEIKSQMQ
jgi:hypothetical protein